MFFHILLSTIPFDSDWDGGTVDWSMRKLPEWGHQETRVTKFTSRPGITITL